MVPNGWNVRELKNLTSIYDGTHSTPKYVEQGVPFYSVEHLTKGDFSKTKFISKEVFHKENKRVKLERDDILMTRIGDIGTAIHLNWNVNASFYVSLALIKANNSFNSLFLAQYINSSEFNRELWKRTIHVAFPKKINLGEIGNCLVLVPSLPEQRKIAKILFTWDKAISTTERLIDNSKQQKKALMQQLLTGKKRLLDDSGKPFEGEWEEFQLGQLFKERVETGFNDLPLISITSTGGVIGRDDVGRKDTSNKDKSKYRRICPNDIGYNTMRMWQGVSGLSDLEGIVSPAYTILIPQNGVSPKFGSYLFKLPKLIHIFERNSQGLVSDTWNLKYPHFAQIKWHFPNYQEQDKIASVLINADKEIELLKQQLADLKQEKKALMQQLLTGKRRVKVDDKEVA